MSDEDYVAELRSYGMLSTNKAADRIEQLVATNKQLTAEAAKMLAEQDSEYNRKTNDMIERHAEQVKALTAERDRLRESLLCGRRLWAIAQDDRVRLLIQLEQCEKRHD